MKFYFPLALATVAAIVVFVVESVVLLVKPKRV